VKEFNKDVNETIRLQWDRDRDRDQGVWDRDRHLPSPAKPRPV